jgi:hypothetical protein
MNVTPDDDEVRKPDVFRSEAAQLLGLSLLGLDSKTSSGSALFPKRILDASRPSLHFVASFTNDAAERESPFTSRHRDRGRHALVHLYSSSVGT